MAEQTVNSLEAMRDALPDLAAEARDRAEEFEQERQIAPDFADKLKDAGIYRILVAEAQGGLGGDLIDWFDMSTCLAEADASTGWTSAHGASCSALIANTADEKFVQTFFSDSGALAAWSNMPRVEVESAEGGLKISGRWGFETGCTAATYVGGMLALPDQPDGEPPHCVVALAPIEEAEIDRTWNPIGLAGTGSHDIVFDDVFVPWGSIFDWPDSTPSYSYPTAVLVPGGWMISICAATTHLGLARRAIDEARKELDGKIDRFTLGPVLAKPAVLNPLEEAEGLLFACHSGMKIALTEIWDSGLQGEPLSPDTRLKIHLAASTAVHQCEAIVRSAYDVAGASAIRRNGVLQRLYRDASCLTHHVTVSRDSFERIGRVRCGFEPLNWAI
ncbi:MAG: alkylation response protein AidB-like acyl-CoA dehydrogenase [Gammaproteobacteria bacterium]|jgi:alkylation response protein AidB-like acyl-CoA dehydrogenase